MHAATNKTRGGNEVVLQCTVDFGETGHFAKHSILDGDDMDHYYLDSAKVNGLNTFAVFDSDKVHSISVYSGDPYGDEDEESDDYYDDEPAAKRQRTDDFSDNEDSFRCDFCGNGEDIDYWGRTSTHCENCGHYKERD